MSLFRVHDAWSTNCGDQGGFDASSMVVADLRDSGIEDILVGSHDGTLRIYTPLADRTSEGGLSYKPTDLLLEVQLLQPVLQIVVGKFVS